MTDTSRLLSEYAGGNYKKVSGWLGSNTISQIMAMDALQRSLGITGHVGEIGVHHGKLFILLYLLAREGENALAIDIFGAQELNVDKSGRGDLDVFLGNLKAYAGGIERLKTIGADSTTLGGDDLIAEASGPLRFLSIDGGHLARIVRHDLATAAASLCEGGVVILDDFFNPEFPGVCEGTNQFFFYDNGRAGKKLVPFLVGMNKVYLTTEGYAEKYLDCFCEKDLGRPFGSTAKFRVYEAEDHAIFVTELFGSTVLGYSPDRFSLGHKLRKWLNRRVLKLREGLGETSLWKRIKNTGIGTMIARSANKFASF